MDKIKTPALVDAQEMAKQHPETFQVPALNEIQMARPGSLLKVCVEPERFWVEVESVRTEANGMVFIGRIDNDLLSTDEHGLTYGDRISFEPRHVYQLETDVAFEESGARLKVAREALGLTEKQLADKIRTRETPVKRWESGFPIDSASLLALDMIVGIRKDWLERGEKPMFHPYAQDT